MQKLSIAALLLVLLISPTLRAQIVGRQTNLQKQTMPEIVRMLKSESPEKRETAIALLQKIETRESSRLLLLVLNDNLAHKRGNIYKYGSLSAVGAELLTYTPSQNEEIVKTLGYRKYKEALPVLRRLLKMKDERKGIGQRTVAESIYMISSRPVRYIELDEMHIYPQPEEPSNGFGVLRSRTDDELKWEESSLNARIREIEYYLEENKNNGPRQGTAPYRKTLNEEFGLTTLLALMKNGDPLVRPYVAELLGILGDWKTTLPALVGSIADQDPRVRYRGVRALGYFEFSTAQPEQAVVILAALKKAMSDTEPNVRHAVVVTLSGYAADCRSKLLSEPLKEFAPLLIQALRDDLPYVRAEGARVLGDYGPPSPEVIPAVTSLLKARQDYERSSAVNALGKFASYIYLYPFQNEEKERDQRKRDIARALLPMAHDPVKDVRYSVAERLGDIGPVVPGVLPALTQLTRDRARGVRHAAAGALGKFEKERSQTIPVLTRMLTIPDEEPEVLEQVLRSLGRMGPAARSAEPQVRKLLKSDNSRIREYAGYALADMARQEAVRKN